MPFFSIVAITKIYHIFYYQQTKIFWRKSMYELTARVKSFLMSF